MNADLNPSPGSRTRRRLANAGIGLGVAASLLASAAVATAAPSHAAVQSQADVTRAVQQPARATRLAKSGAATPYSSVTAIPGIVRPGGRVTISGNAPKNARAGKWITLMSEAFASKQSVNGIPAIRTQVLVNGKYSVTATIRSGLKPTTYAVSGSFNGKSLDTVAWMTVRSR